MNKPIQQQLDELQSKVTVLIAALNTARGDNSRLQTKLNNADAENRHLREKLLTAQQQVEQIMDQWFPELDFNGGEKRADN